MKDEIRAFSSHFAKYPVDERKSINVSLKHLGETFNEEERSEQSLRNSVEDLFDKSESPISALDSIRAQSSQVLLKELVVSAPLDHRDKVLQFSITEKPKAIVDEQGRK